MTRSSFGMPDTSRAARHILKDYVNAKLLYAHPPPGIKPDEFMESSRAKTLAKLEEEFKQGRKRAPIGHVVRNADTYIAPAGGASVAGTEQAAAGSQQKERQTTSHSQRANAATSSGRSGKQKAAALDEYYFTESGPAPRPVIMGRSQGPIEQDSGLGYSRSTMYPHQRRLGPDGRPMLAPPGGGGEGIGSKKHFKRKEGKKRSGKGYD